MKKVTLMWLFLCIGILTTRAQQQWTPYLPALTRITNQGKIKATNSDPEKRFSPGKVPDSQTPPAKKFLLKTTAPVDLADFLGNRMLLAHAATGILACDTVQIIKITEDSIRIEGFLYADIAVGAKINPADGSITIAPQQVADIAEGPVSLCSVDTEANIYSEETPVSGTLEGGNIHLETAFGFFVTSGPSKGAYLTVGIMKYADMITPNGRLTNRVISFKDNILTPANRQVTSESDWIYIRQIASNLIRVSHIPGITGYYDMEMKMNYDGSLSIDPQTLFTAGSSGNFSCYKMTETVSGGTIKISASILSPIDATYAETDSVQVSWGKWMVGNTSAGSFAALYESSVFRTTAGLTFPVKPAASFDGEGTQQNPYLIRSPKDLEALSVAVNTDPDIRGSKITEGDNNYYRPYKDNYFRLENDLDLSGYHTRIEPIGNSELRFAGTFDGNGHTVKGLSYRDYAYDYCGLFGCIDLYGSVKNLTIDSLRISSMGYVVGGITGKNYGIIDGCRVTRAIISATAGYQIGGISGQGEGKISNCSFSGDITALGYMGGIVGKTNADLINCHAKGNLYMTGSAVFVGGIAGYITGIVGENERRSLKLTDSYFSGIIQASNNQVSLGGIAGMAALTEIARCFSVSRLVNLSSVSSYLGGLAGSVYESQIHDCYVAGQIYNPETANCGGLVGHTSEQEDGTGTVLTNCYSTASVVTKSTEDLRALVGASPHITTTNCYYDRQIVAIPHATAALNTAEMTTAAGLKDFDASIWNFTDGLYPRLKGIDTNDAAYVSAAPLFLGGNNDVNLVSTDFRVSTANGVSWKGLIDGKYDEAGGHSYTWKNGAGILNSTQSADTIFAFSNQVSKFFIMNVAPMPFRGEGTAGSPWEIGTKNELLKFSEITNNTRLTFEGCYLKLTGDIDMEGDTLTPVCRDQTGKFRFEGTFDGDGHTIHHMIVCTVEFYQEGNAAGKPAGEVNPKSDASYNYGGFIGTLGEKGVVKNLTFASDCRFELFSYGGAVAGSSYGSIENCKNFAPVNVYFSKAGGMTGDLLAGGIIRQCYNAGVIRAGSYTAGGIAGAATGALIENCANTGSVGALYINSYQQEGKQYKAGGIVGDNAKSTLINVVNSGDVVSYKQAGGIVGYHSGASATPAIITHAVNYGWVETLTDISTAGQIAGNNNGGTIVNSYFDCQLRKLDGADNTAVEGAVPLTSVALTQAALPLPDSAWIQTAGSYPLLKNFKDEPQMKLAALATVLFAPEDFASCIRNTARLGNTGLVQWSLAQGTAFTVAEGELTVAIPAAGAVKDTLIAAYQGINRIIPLNTLNSQIFDGDGTETSPYLIQTAADMQKLSTFVEETGYDFEGNYFKVTENLDFTGLDYSPVTRQTCMFQGIFDGNGKKISHLVYSDTDDKTVQERGLFGIIGRNGRIGNLTIDETNTFEAYQKCGAFVGGLYGQIVNCTNRAAVSATGATYAGGIAGYAYANSSIRKCRNTGDITAKSGCAGGILGGTAASASVTADTCTNEGKISASNKAGGIAGSASVRVAACTNSGEIEAGTSYAAGIVGEALLPSAVRTSTNTGTVTANTSYSAGIIALSAAHTDDMPLAIDCCCNKAAVASGEKGYAAGIAASLKAGAILTSCYNEGAVQDGETVSANYLAGIVADMTGSSSGRAVIENCYNTAAVSGSRYIGGIAGGVKGDEYARVSRCYNTGNITSDNESSAYAAGLVGNGGYDMLDCWNRGTVTATGKYIGGLSGYLTGKAYRYERCFNAGKIISADTHAGGLVGMGRPYMYDCYNFGEVTAADNVGGLVGYPGNAMSPTYDVKLRRSYNAGKLTATGGTNVGNACAINPDCEYLTVDSVYYDSSVSQTYPNDADYSTAATPAEMCTLPLGDAFDYAVAAYPSLKAQANNPVNSFYVAMVLLNEGETLSDVKTKFRIGTPAGVQWTHSGNLTLDGNEVILHNEVQGEAATLTLTAGELKRTYDLILNADPSGIGENAVSGKTVVNRTYYTVNGIVVNKPASAGIFIEKVTYDDGTAEIRKTVKTEAGVADK